MSTTQASDSIIATRVAQFECLLLRPYAQVLHSFIDSFDPQRQSSPVGFAAIKSSTVRSVFQGSVAGLPRPVFLKWFRPARWSDHARDWLRGARGPREFHNLRRLAELGFPASEPVAAGALRSPRGARSFLLTLAAPGVALPRGPQAPDVAASVGLLLRRLHDAGVRIPDLHPGNVLANGLDLTLVDLTGANFGDPLDEIERAHALAFFCSDLDGGCGDPAARPLLKTYRAEADLVSEATRIGRHLRASALDSFGQRALRACRQTEIERRKSLYWYRHVPSRELHGAARTLLEQTAAITPYKSGRRGAVWLQDALVAKSRNAAAARRLWVAAYWLLFAGVPVARPILLRCFAGGGQVVFGRVPRPNLREELIQGLAEPELLAAAKSLGRSIGRLHAHGLRNRDLKLENLVRDVDRTVTLVDLDGVRRRSVSDRRGQAADLGRLLAAWRASQVRCPSVIRAFLWSYTRAYACLLPRPNLREMLHAIEVRAGHWASAHRRAHPGDGNCAMPGAT